MNWRDGLPAVGVSVLLHLLVVGLVMFSWAGTPELRRPKPAPPHIQAVVLERPQPAAPKPAAPQPPPRPTPPPPRPDPPAPKPAPPKPAPTPAPKPAPAPAPEPAPQPAPTPPPPAPSFEQPDLTELLAQEEVTRAEQRQAASEQTPQPAQSDSDSLEADPETAEYVAAIQSTVGRRWTRPPSARNGMEVKLNVRLAPGGDVLSVTLQQSSGDAALDRTAVAAVKNAGRLPVPDGAAFEKFREFTFLFRPEDMRL
ncbi:cell envelope integrity protein TolA [Alcanivorax quisquiliarum]|uniref:Cell envelope integrity protein TolA n=1 Tax=Alcanivorax quisquiliarum TaxID=2933565 RepID=A0ABT0E8M8_9GAMM|nr:cell envelope integrity protein TolA [Alcanivorax quisquiliarum]MCK0538201.1 cell envelope integrity protein TolA [Alcanivorax quisquiliarum]